jgi:uncharacterized protein YndB with AHSA1/START domain
MTEPVADTVVEPVRSIRMERELDAPRELVFRAWTDPAQFAVWFGGHSARLEDVVMDVRTGGAWSARMVLEGGHEIRWAGEFVELDEPARLRLTLTDAPDEDPGEPLTVDLEDLGGGRTRMVVVQRGNELSEEQYAQARAGWEHFFDVMAELLAA